MSSLHVESDDGDAVNDCALQPCENCDCPLSRQHLLPPTSPLSSSTASAQQVHLEPQMGVPVSQQEQHQQGQGEQQKQSQPQYQRQRPSSSGRPLALTLADLDLTSSSTDQAPRRHTNQRCSSCSGQPCGGSCPVSTHTAPANALHKKILSHTTGAMPPDASRAAPAGPASAASAAKAHKEQHQPSRVDSKTSLSRASPSSSFSISVDLDALNRDPRCDACPECDDVCGFPTCEACALKAKHIEQRKCKQRRRGCNKSVFTMCQVRRHNREDDCWMVAHRKVYDVTSFVANEFHRAGMQTIIRKGGTDVTRDFDFHSSRARKHLWSKYMIGVLARCPSESPQRHQSFGSKASALKKLFHLAW